MPNPTVFDQVQPVPSFTPSFDVEDFFNLDLLSGGGSLAGNANIAASSTPTVPSGAASTSSRSSSRSPSESFSQLPPTPPQPSAPAAFDISAVNFGSSSFNTLPTISEDSLFAFNFDGNNETDFFKMGVDPMAVMNNSSFDLFGAFGGDLTNATSAGASTAASATTSASATTTASTSPAAHQAFDPQLVRTPASSHDGDSDDERDNGDDEDEEDGERSVLVPIKVGGRGKARKGTLQSGGVTKKSAVGPQSIFGSLSDKSVSGSEKGGKFSKEEKDDDWRPSPEEYQKMSSKEKRQLRNKISARNFRVRRKEYIHTLEGDIAERDRLIEAIRTELGSTKSENHALRQEVAALKKAILEGRASPMLPPPAPLSPLSPLTSFASLQTSSASSSSSSSNNNIVRPNTQKDLPTSPRLAAIRGSGAFWGGQAGAFGGLGGGITPVHTAIIPETNFGSAAKSNVNNSVERASENMNPALNHVPAPIAAAASKVFSAGHAANQQQTQQQEQQNQQNLIMSQVLSQLQAAHGFDAFSDVNPFTLKTLDAYRMQLWNRVAIQAQQQRARSGQPPISYPSPSSSNTSPSSSPSPAPGSPTLSGLATGLRPHYFTAGSSSSSASGSSRTPLSGLLSGKGLHHGLPTPPTSPRMGTVDKNAAQMQKERERVQHALLASIASHTVLHKMGQAFWDAFSGSSASGSATKNWDSEKVRKVMEGTAVLRVVDVEPPKKTSTSADVLEESMRSLSLSSASSKDEKREKKGLFARMGCAPCAKPSTQ